MIKAILTSLGMFTKLPVKTGWNEEGGAKAVCFLPLCGLICGAFSALVLILLRIMSVDANISAFILVVSNFCICGFIHMDGFMDVADAVFSARDREGKIKILKDSSVGAFSVISVCLLLIGLYSSFVSAVESLNPAFLLAVPFVSRALTVTILFTFKPFSQTGILIYFREGKKAFYPYLSAILAIAAIAATLIFISAKAFFALIAGCIAQLMLAIMCSKAFGGINGDVSGACLITCEFVSYLIINIL